LRCIALRCIALRCIALHCIALRCIALHYIMYIISKLAILFDGSDNYIETCKSVLQKLEIRQFFTGFFCLFPICLLDYRCIATLPSSVFFFS
jgi:hypothetical protein